MTPAKYYDLIKERVAKVVYGKAMSATKIDSIMSALDPLLDEYHDLRNQNAALLKVLRAQSGAFLTLQQLPPDESPG